jgi:hypothetical protein
VIFLIHRYWGKKRSKRSRSQKNARSKKEAAYDLNKLMGSPQPDSLNVKQRL